MATNVTGLHVGLAISLDGPVRLRGVPERTATHRGTRTHTVDRAPGSGALDLASSVVEHASSLPVLLSRVLSAQVDELEADDRGLGNVASLPVWSNVLRGVDAAASERELATVTRISRRLAAAAVTGAARRGWLVATKGSAGRTIELTTDGRASDDHWRRRLDAHEARHAGSDLRVALDAVVRRLPLELPWFPAPYGVADPSAIGGTFVAPRPTDGLPAHGQDWRPVRRGDGDSTSGVPLTALLSQCLVAFSIDYESAPAWPLASTALVVRHLRSDPRPLADAPAGHGITGHGTSLLERHGVVVVIPDPHRPRPKLVRLTELGDRIRTHHERRLDQVETGWRERYGDELVADLRRALEAEPAASDATRPDHVVAPPHLG